MLQISEKGES